MTQESGGGTALQTGSAGRSPPSEFEADDFWDWFDAPVEVPDRPWRRAEPELPPLSPTRRALSAAGWAVVLGSLFVAALLVLPRLFGMDVLSVYSGSMAPAVQAGDAVIVRPLLSADLRAGDIIVYRPPHDPSVLITHRVVSVAFNPGVGDYAVLTRGDANAAPDPPWRAAPNDVFGKVVLRLPYLGRVLDMVAGVKGKIVALAALLAFLTLASLSRRKVVTAPHEAHPV